MEQKSKKTIKKLWLSIGMVCIAIMTVVSLAYAWFVHNEKVATLMEVAPPDDITILGPNAQELERLDLSYTNEDIQESVVDDVVVKTVTLNRIICVQTTATMHRLEIVHTTNMKNLTFSLHHVTDTGDVLVGDNLVTDGKQSGNPMTVRYDPTAIPGAYINVEKEQESHKYASDAYHSQNYGEYDQVQIHAEPVYWLMNEPYSVPEEQQPVGIDSLFNTYYVLTISWTEDTKETDMFYILVRTEETEE